MAGGDDASMVFDRGVSASFLAALGPGGWLAPLRTYPRSRPEIFDIQLRRFQRGTRSWASLYAGLSAVATFEEKRPDSDRFRFRTHPTYEQAAGASFDPSWRDWQSGLSLGAGWPAIANFIDTTVERPEARRHIDREGVVHAALANNTANPFIVIQREAGPSFTSTASREDGCGPIQARIHQAMVDAERTEPWWPTVRNNGQLRRLGTEADLLAIGDDGRLLVIEAKPADALEGIVWAPAQVRLYAELFLLLGARPGFADLVNEMADQRHRIGLGRRAPTLVAGAPTVPVIAVGAPTATRRPSPKVGERVSAIQAALDDHYPAEGIERTQLWFLDAAGNIAEKEIL